jgi:VWFA-related protein
VHRRFDFQQAGFEMKTTGCLCKKIGFHPVIWIGLFTLGVVLISHAQVNSSLDADHRIKIGVEEVRVDAVAIDNKGRPVTDLTAEDFEVYQDGKLQQLNALDYIDEPEKREKATVSPKTTKTELLVSKPKLPKDKVCRTIAFFVNLSGISPDPRPYLRKFIESQMGPDDLMGIIGSGPLVFSSDKRELLLRINGIGGRFSCVDASGCLTSELPNVHQALFDGSSTSSIFDMFWDTRTDDECARRLKAEVAPIQYAIRALQDMPGRKHLVLTWEHIFCDARRLPGFQNRLLNEVADEAWRAGVVISTWDYCNTQSKSPYGRFNKLFQKTGGIYTDNQNFLYKGRPALDVLNGYYLLSYTPPPNTFDNKRSEKYHKIKIEVKRPGVKVRYRDGYFRSPGPSTFAVVSQADSMLQAIFSPFRYSDLQLNLSSGYAYTPESGYFLRSWMHLDGKELTFEEAKGGEYLLSLELQALTADSYGRIQDAKGYHYRFRLNDAEILQARNNGIDLKTYLPIQNPGNYYVSAAVKDMASGKIGSGYQFIEVPDLNMLRLSLSSIFVLTDEKDGSTISSGKIKDESDSFRAMRQWLMLQRSPALRIYKPGESFDYMTVLYNAKNKSAHTPNLEFRSILFKDGLIYRQETEDINLNGIDELGRIPIAKKFVIENGMDEGDYLLQLVVIDKITPGKSRVAAQGVNFTIRKDQ